MMEWQHKADLCLAMGTSLSGFNADSVPATAARKCRKGQGLGLVLINLQRTPYDEMSALRIYAKVDVVMEMLMAELGLEVCVGFGGESALHSPCVHVSLGEDVLPRGPPPPPPRARTTVLSEQQIVVSVKFWSFSLLLASGGGGAPPPPDPQT